MVSGGFTCQRFEIEGPGTFDGFEEYYEVALDLGLRGVAVAGLMLKNSPRDQASALTGFAPLDHPVELRGLISRDTQATPVGVLQVFGEKYDLPDVISIMGELAVDRLRHGMRLAPDRYAARQIGISQWLERVEEASPAVLPQPEDFSASGRGIHKFGITITNGALPVGVRKAGPAGTHVAG